MSTNQKIRTFPEFPENKICPVCKTNENKECLLIPIDGTKEDNICKAIPIHLDCAIVTNYHEETGIFYIFTK